MSARDDYPRLAYLTVGSLESASVPWDARTALDEIDRLRAERDALKAEVQRLRGLVGSLPPVDCTNHCFDADCDCSGVWRNLADIPGWAAAPAQSEPQP